MGLQLWINDPDYYFVDTDLEGVQVGQHGRMRKGIWTVEVNDSLLTAPDLEAARRLFLKVYDQSHVALGPAGLGEGDDIKLVDDFEIIDLR